MDIGQTMTTIIQTNTNNCDCKTCSRWNTKAMPTLVNSMEKRGKDIDYIQRLLDNIKNKDFICNKNTIINDKKNKQSAGGGTAETRGVRSFRRRSGLSMQSGQYHPCLVQSGAD